MFTKDSINYIKGLSESADEYANHVKEAMDSRYWSTFGIDIAKSTAELTGLETLEEFSKRPIETQNTKDARRSNEQIRLSY